MAWLKVGETLPICPIHGVPLPHLTSSHSMRYRVDCDICGTMLMFTGCPLCRDVYVMRCSACSREFCIDDGCLVRLGPRGHSTPLCYECQDSHEPWSNEEDDDDFVDESEDADVDVDRDENFEEE